MCPDDPLRASRSDDPLEEDMSVSSFGLSELKPHRSFKAPDGPVCLVVLDGVGLAAPSETNAWHLAQTPTLDALMGGDVVGRLRAHGTAVGMPSDKDMGNSEVGHNALGAGRVFDQGAKLVDQAIRSGRVFESRAWREAMSAVSSGGTLHLIGLWSDGNVHSHMDHPSALMKQAAHEGARRIRVHPLLDGRDVGATTALDYIAALEAELNALRASGVDAQIASGGGRMCTTMDRYEADWSIVARGWDAHVHGRARHFDSAAQAVETFREDTPGIIDQNLPAFVIADAEGPVGTIEDGDAVLLFHFRGDRAIEISRAFDTPAGEAFPFERGEVPRVCFAGMMEYDGDLHIPRRYLVEPPCIDRTVGEFLAMNGLKQVACSETQKFGHVTYFFNGNRSGAFDPKLERYIEIPSDTIDFALKPAMQAEGITTATLRAIDEMGPHFVRLNYANGDMVGHTGVLSAAIASMEALDKALARLLQGISARGGIALVTADHGNCEEMAQLDKRTGEPLVGPSLEGYSPSTAHSLNPVPLVVTGAGLPSGVTWREPSGGALLSHVSATCINLMGYATPDGYLPGLLQRR
jgi:2,3-bisphosphoglycerate-independent phosphoglycerate mutase